MSIFDVIRYPISWPPTKDELAAVPAELRRAWKVTWFAEDYTLDDMVIYYRLAFNAITESRPPGVMTFKNSFSEIQRLRKMIAEYGE